MKRVADPALAVIIGVAAGLILAEVHRPRLGMWLIAGTLLVAAFARGVLHTADAGSLAVRRKGFDIAMLVVLAAAIGTLATVSPLSR